LIRRKGATASGRSICRVNPSRRSRIRHLGHPESGRPRQRASSLHSSRPDAHAGRRPHV